MPDKVLVVDDDEQLCETLKSLLELPLGDFEPFEVEVAHTAAEARQAVARMRPVLVLCDMRLPDGDGISLLPELKALAGDAPVVIMTGYSDMATTIRAMKIGAFDYLHKPFDIHEVEAVALRALDLRRQSTRSSVLTVEPVAQPRLGDLVGRSPQMKEIVKQIGQIAASKATVLITGESGTGKELVAQVIHAYSSESPLPFVGINCSALVDTLLESELFGHEKGAFTGAGQAKPGKFEVAEEGTIFLDEIAEMSLPLQAKLLRVLQEREFERVGGVKKLPLRARIIAATNRELEAEVEAKRFREDLYQRLKVVTLELPPLRHRPQDIPILVEHLLGRIAGRIGKRVNRVPDEVMRHLQALPWIGNVRELENALTRAVILAPGDLLLKEHLPELPTVEAPPVGAPRPERPLTLAEAEERAILHALEVAAGHKGRVCELLGISRPTLERKLRKHGIAWTVAGTEHGPDEGTLPLGGPAPPPESSGGPRR